MIDIVSMFSQTMKKRLSGWQATLSTTEAEVERHYTGQSERIISLQQQQCFLNVSNDSCRVYINNIWNLSRRRLLCFGTTLSESFSFILV